MDSAAYIKSLWPNCSSNASWLGFCSLDSTKVRKIAARPIFSVNICELNSTGILHIAIKESAASYSLYNALLLEDLEFPREKFTVMDPEVLTTFIALPYADKTLVGMDCIIEVKVVLDFTPFTWNFDDQLAARRHLLFESHKSLLQR